MADMLKQVQKRIKQLRLSRGYSYAKLAAKVGCSKTHLWMLETSEEPIDLSLSLVRKFSLEFGLTIEEFVFGEAEGDPLLAQAKDLIDNIKHSNARELE